MVHLYAIRPGSIPYNPHSPLHWINDHHDRLSSLSLPYYCPATLPHIVPIASAITHKLMNIISDEALNFCNCTPRTLYTTMQLPPGWFFLSCTTVFVTLPFSSPEYEY